VVLYSFLYEKIPVPVVKDPLKEALKRWRYGEFKGYEDIFINPERFEEILFLNFLKGNLSLRCNFEGMRLNCKGFNPIRLRKIGDRYRILNTYIYLNDTSGSLGDLRKNLSDWLSKVKLLGYYRSLEVCVGQLRDRTEADSLYLEKKAYENDITVLEKLNGLNMNVRFYEIFKKRVLHGHVCLGFEDVKSAHDRFSRFVRTEDRKVNLRMEIKKRDAKVFQLERQLAKKLESLTDPLALAFYKRGLEYYAKGDLESARIFFKKALKIQPNFERAEKALHEVENLINR